MTPSLAPPQALQVVRPNCHPALRRLRVQETDDEITISGCVASYYLKQLAQETLMPVRRGRALVNQVVVDRE
jgi:hypothetical protein